jgi:GGDEF domain-containing protein
MKIEKYIEKVIFKEIKDIEIFFMRDLVERVEKDDVEAVYITKDGYPVYLFEIRDFLNAFLKNEIHFTVMEYMKLHPKTVYIFSANEKLVNVYYKMREKNLKRAAVIKDKRLIGEITFKLISDKLTDILIKDPLTDAFNDRYFQIFIENYKKFEEPIGLIYIDIKNLGIIEGLYGEEKVNKILKESVHTLANFMRDIDFIFRSNNRLKILIFNDLEATKKIVERVKEILDTLEVDGIKIAYKLAFSHVPSLQNTILLAIDDIETKLID